MTTSFKCGSDGNCREVYGTDGYATKTECISHCSPSFSLNDSFLPWWVYVIIALGILFIVIVITIMIVRQRKMSKRRQQKK
jgi:hypothetical protein